MMFKETLPNKVPMDLLLEADPSEKSIATYLSDSWCFIALENERMVATCVVKPLSNSIAEIFNVSVLPEYQQKGIGSKLLRYVLAKLSSKGVKRVELGTGTFGYQLTYYQRLGFRVDSVVKNHFVDHYAEPIYESGIQHKDMLRLYIQL
ncbi:GNAT family N-acetyltransferase [Vibrio europaeus]|uniref:GNAT family N-acetyltransferase n=1 Tax=Vibrio europaeus TaxID=300876 RepID=UPI00233F856B|nr:GNAT family N-acetyltransferase [Vibrio europaeus]MDC5851931.1 GNAT family N-acetyltransferase [Vibrio europaeus]